MINGIPLDKIGDIIEAGKNVFDAYKEINSIIKRIKRGEGGEKIKKDVADLVESLIKAANNIVGVIPNDETLMKILNELLNVREQIETGLTGKVIDQILDVARRLGIYTIEAPSKAFKQYIEVRDNAANDARNFFNNGTIVDSMKEENGNV